MTNKTHPLWLRLTLTLCGMASIQAQADTIIELHSGQAVTEAALLALIKTSDFVLLGELHDNPQHHARRGALLAQLKAPAVLVAEHLPRPARVQLTPELDLSAALAEAGFDAKAWRWPLHQALFDGAAQAGLPLLGGNATRELARQVAREGRIALPDDLGATLDANPLSAAARASLDADLVLGHCGQLSSGPRLDGMVWAQRLRDASLWRTLQAAATTGAQPAVLLAGNGHVRLDYGVGQLVRGERPQAKLISVGFGEAGKPLPAGDYTHIWITAAAERADPCAGFALPGR
jgi:uncharacterized iron-regulated protein